ERYGLVVAEKLTQVLRVFLVPGTRPGGIAGLTPVHEYRGIGVQRIRMVVAKHLNATPVGVFVQCERLQILASETQADGVNVGSTKGGRIIRTEQPPGPLQDLLGELLRRSKIPLRPQVRRHGNLREKRLLGIITRRLAAQLEGTAVQLGGLGV